MPQKYFPIMPAVDWLQLSCTTPGAILTCPQDTEKFAWKERDFGTKQYAKVYNVSVCHTTESPLPFCTICAAPRMSTMPGNMLSLKLDNQILYDNSLGDWRILLKEFCDAYGIYPLRINRCDLALDFLYLNNRVSGPKLIRNIKNFVWLKTGSVKVSEHYTMPYSVTHASDTLNGQFDVQYYLQQQQMQTRVETMMFGTLRSDAAVCIYDKTAELAQHSVKVNVDGEDKLVCSKEYIRDAHKRACVYDTKMHTWRIEIRVKSNASFIRDIGSDVERCLCLSDLDDERLSSTIYAALNHYFYLVETPDDMLKNGTLNVADVRLKNKKRLKKVDLVPAIPSNITMVRSRKTLKASQFTRGVLNRIEEWATRKERAEKLLADGADGSIVDKAIAQVTKLSEYKSSPKIKELATLMTQVKSLVVDCIEDMPDVCRSTLVDAISLVEHFRILDTQGYSKVVAKKFEDLATAIDYKDGVPSSVAHGLSFVPSDAEILRSARNIVQEFYTAAQVPERTYYSIRLYEGNIYKAIRVINERPEFPPLQAYKALIGYMATKEYLSDERWQDILREFRHTPFFLMVLCKFDMEVYFRTLHFPAIEGYSMPYLLPHQILRIEDAVRWCASIKLEKLDPNIIV